jgi:excinuclease ABC subunit B
MGRAARHINGHVILYADRITGSMDRALKETKRRRIIQAEYNTQHGITPKTIQKAIKEDRLSGMKRVEEEVPKIEAREVPDEELPRVIRELEQQMDLAARNLEFEKAALLRDEIGELRAKERAGRPKKPSLRTRRGQRQKAQLPGRWRK